MLNLKKITLSTQEEIMYSWGNKEKVLVSIVCVTYNHEPYIEDAIKGFLMQETDFAFEIIIHDDASTDGTASIVRQYKKQYPNIIKPIYQIENQYSKGGFKPSPYAATFAQGEFIALCEGDDFWLDKSKLQKQFLGLAKNSKLNLVISKAIALYPNGEICDFCDLGSNEKIIPFKDCIIGPVNDFFPTASFFFRRTVFDELPNWFYSEAPVGDYYIQLFASKNNGALYLPHPTTVYRKNTIGSYNATSNHATCVLHDSKRIECKLKVLNSMDLSPTEKKALKLRILRFRLSLLSHLRAEKKYIISIMVVCNIFFNHSHFVFSKLIKKIMNK